MKQIFNIPALAAALAFTPAALAQNAVDEKPVAAAMVGDLLVARPIGAAMTVGGTAAFLISLPFTLLSGSTEQAAETLVAGPARTTFKRCLGCRTPEGSALVESEMDQDAGRQYR